MFLNFAQCGSCGYCITGEGHTKKSGRRYFYYRCTHKNRTRPCKNRSFIRQEMFAEEIKRNVELVTIPYEWKEKFLARIETWEVEASNERQTQIDLLRTELAALKVKIDRINDGFTNGAFEIQEYKELKNPLVPLKADLEQRIVAVAKDKANRLEPLRNFILEAKAAQKLVKEKNWLEMKSFLKKSD